MFIGRKPLAEGFYFVASGIPSSILYTQKRSFFENENAEIERIFNARVVKLVDTQVSEACDRKVVLVQVQSRAQ